MKKKQKSKLKNKKVIIILAIVIAALLIVTAIKTFGGQKDMVKLQTNYGDIVIKVYDDMPITSNNFLDLTKSGTYNGVIFHRVIDGFMIQGGDPTRTGMGDPSIPTIKDELPNKHSNIRGTVAMAKTSAPNSASSQFFINTVDNLFLDPNYSVFGVVVSGMDVVDKISKVQTNAQDRPLEDVIIKKATIV